MAWVSDTETLIKALSPFAWPIIALVLAILFRSEIRELIANVRRGRVGPVGFEVWERTAQEVREEVQNGQTASPSPEPLTLQVNEAPNGVHTEDLTSLATVAPTAAVLEAYDRIEDELCARLVSAGSTIPSIKAGGLAKLAAEQGLVDEKAVRSIEGITLLRNLAAHGHVEGLTPAQAMEYLSMINILLLTALSPANSPNRKISESQSTKAT